MSLEGLGPDEIERYGRHLSIPEVGVRGQARLRRARVLIIGAGGLGSPAGLYLAAAGVGQLGIVDHDTVEISNLQRQILHDTASVGRSKLESARERLEAINPHVEIETFETRLEASNALDILEGFDVVVDGSDNFPTRYLVNDACVLLGIPFAYGAILRFEGQASLFGAPGGPCYRCLFREPPPAGLVPSCAEAGVLGVLPGIVGAIQATEALKWILGAGDPLAGRLLLIDALRMEFRSLDIPADPECAVCGERPSITELVDYDRFCGAPANDSAGSMETDVEHPEIDVTELKRRLENGEDVQLIDVREAYEWEICNLSGAGARLVPLSSLPEALASLDRDRPLVVHCRSGPRGTRAVEYLRMMGYEDAVNLTGGILAWGAAFDPGMPVY